MVLKLKIKVFLTMKCVVGIVRGVPVGTAVVKLFALARTPLNYYLEYHFAIHLSSHCADLIITSKSFN